MLSKLTQHGHERHQVNMTGHNNEIYWQSILFTVFILSISAQPKHCDEHK
jgi:hypothetical protein